MKDILVSCHQEPHEQKKNFFDSLITSLQEQKYRIIYTDNIEDGIGNLLSNARIVCYIFDWDSFDINEIEAFADINPDLPMFATYFSHTDLDLELSNFKINLDFLQYDRYLINENTKRIETAIHSYLDLITPPFTKGLMKYVAEQKYTFCTPGHMGGTAFTRSPVGSIFYNFFGENVFKADVSISMPELGSLLDHSGLHKEAEDYIAKTFNADHSYIVTNGTSTANKIVGLFAASSGDTVLIDRNCHKSLCHFMLMADVTPIYLRPTRNSYGILGGIPKHEFTTQAIEDKIANSTLKTSWPSYAVITNSTYDGLLYNTSFIKKNLAIKHLHFDSAWAPYTHFHPIYKNKYGMCDGDSANSEQIIFETHSTHKLLAAFSQASMIHIKGNIDKEVMNECYMMHTSTSPLYQITASCEVAAAMVSGNRGYHLLNKAINRALNFRNEIKKLRASSNDWYFDVWQPDNITNLPHSQLNAEHMYNHENQKNITNCFKLKSTDTWHDFKAQDDNHIFLDPIKVTILTPGITNNAISDFGIPANIVAMYLDDHGIILEKTGPYSMLFLFSIGVSTPKSMKLLTILNKFKRDFDENKTVQEILPNLYAKYSNFYQNMTIQELARKIHQLMQDYDLPNLMYKAFDYLPRMEMTPYQAFQHLVKGRTKRIKMRNMKDHISAVMILPYPPGVPLIMPGEKITDESIDVLNYLIMLEEIGLEVPGFESDIHGVDTDEAGSFLVKVIDT